MSLRSDFGYVPNQKVPQNVKYTAVQTRLDTGASASKRPPAMPSSLQAQRRNEEFKRIQPATLARMIQDHQEDALESVFNLVEERDDGRSQSSVRASKAAPAKSRAAGTVASVAGSVLSVIHSDTNVDEARKLVLLDLREPEEYAKCRLPFAVSYPAPKINRDQFIPELHRCKRDHSKTLVIYHSNDSTTANLATLLLRKGFESVHVLSGGFEEMVSSYPELLDGDVPEPTSRPPTGSTRSSSVPRLPGEIKRGESIPRRAGTGSRSSSLRSSDAGSVRSASVRSSLRRA